MWSARRARTFYMASPFGGSCRRNRLMRGQLPDICPSSGAFRATFPPRGRLLPRDFMAKQKRGGHCPASFFIKRRRKTERLAVSCNETEPTPLQADTLPSDPAGRSGIPLLYRTMGMFFVPVLSFDAYIVHDFCRNCKGLWCTMRCKIYVYFCATCPIF